MVRGILVTLAALILVFVVGTPFLFYAAISGNTDPLYNVGILCARIVLWLAGVRLKITGRENIPADRAVVYMANHESNADAPAIFVSLPPVVAIGKEEFFRVPILGRCLRRRGFVPVNRRDRQRAIEAVALATERLRAGQSFVVFPEGTRSPDGRLKPFKKGVFIMALGAGAPIIPVSLSGGRQIMRKGDRVIHPGTMRITIHPPVFTEHRSAEEREAVMEEVKRALLAGLEPDEWPIDEAATSA